MGIGRGVAWRPYPGERPVSAHRRAEPGNVIEAARVVRAPQRSLDVLDIEAEQLVEPVVVVRQAARSGGAQCVGADLGGGLPRPRPQAQVRDPVVAMLVFGP